MWEIVYSEEFNLFTIVVSRFGDSGIYRLYARRLRLGVHCPIFRHFSYPEYFSALVEFRKYLSRFPAPLTIYTGGGRYGLR